MKYHVYLRHAATGEERRVPAFARTMEAAMMYAEDNANTGDSGTWVDDWHAEYAEPADDPGAQH